MTRVCLVGESGTNLQYELLSRETAREALAAYDIHDPFENSLTVETVSLGAAVSLLNDLDWYLIRFVDDAFVKEPSISDSEWLSRELATAIRNDEIEPAETGRFLRVYGVEEPPEAPEESDEASEGDTAGTQTTGEDTAGEAGNPSNTSRPQLVEPMLVARTGDQIPEYDLRDVDRTLIVRVTESEFGA